MKPGMCARFVMASCLVFVGASCSSGSDDGAEASLVDNGSTPSVVGGAGDGDVFTQTDSGAEAPVGGEATATVTALPTPTPTVVDSVLDPIDPVSDTGVPGIESDDGFCRSWSEFAGSYNALTFAWAVQDGESAATLEVAASGVMLSSAAGLAEFLPAELEAERQALTVDLTVPILRRATRARELLAAAGLDDAAITAVGLAWLTALTDGGLESETLLVDVPAGSSAAVAEATSTFVTDLPPITEDPSLVVDVQIPLTEDYLFDNCPDRGILAGNDRTS